MKTLFFCCSNQKLCAMRRFKVLFMAMLLLSAMSFGKPLHLQGKWNHILKSTSIKLPMDAFIEETDNKLVINFHADLGSVMVEVTNADGMVVYQEQVETGDVPTLVIPLIDTNEGTLRITDGINNVHGIF